MYLAAASSGILAQRAPEIDSLRADMFAILTGDIPRFERGMKTLEGILATNAKDPVLKVLWGTYRCYDRAESHVLDQLLSTWKRSLAITVGCGMTSAMVFSTSDWGTFSERVLYSMIISFCVGSLFWLHMPALVFYTERRRPTTRWAVRIAGAVILTLNVGVSTGLAALATLDVFP